MKCVLPGVLKARIFPLCVPSVYNHTANLGHQPGTFLFWIIANAGLASLRAWGTLSGPLGKPPGRHY